MLYLLYVYFQIHYYFYLNNVVIIIDENISQNAIYLLFKSDRLIY